MEAARDIGLCLSGGGYRAAVFHLGSLVRLNEAGLLPRLRTVSSVSGGSIVAGLLGLHWRELIFDDTGVASNFSDVIIDPMLIFTGKGLDVGAVLSSAFIPGLVSRRVQRRYGDLYTDATLADLPGRGEGPDFVITATNLATGALFRFSRRGVGDFRRGPDDTSTGFFQAPTIPLTLAVAASSAFHLSSRHAFLTRQRTHLLVPRNARSISPTAASMTISGSSRWTLRRTRWC
jgi:NTE family protein